jgi:general stress protein 26
MKNIYFPEEDITANDLFFVCSMIERVARKIRQRNKYVVNRIGYQGLLRQLSIAGTLHCENPLKVADDWTNDFQLEPGDFDMTFARR